MSTCQQVVILGSTGSIGQQTLSVLAHHVDDFSVFALVARRHHDRLFDQCLRFSPRYAVLTDTNAAAKLRDRLRETACTTEVCTAEDVMAIVSDAEVDVVVAAIVGAQGLPATLAAVKAGKRVLLANKEALVMAGDLFMQAAAQSNAKILPVDSEHNAIFQALPTGYLPGQSLPETVHSVVLTASGGPFRTLPLEAFSAITPAQAVAHPNWSMGAKISVDSATMMNKVLEVVEAHYLFSLPVSQIETIIHPQSVIHSMVRYRDASVLAQLGESDMRIPIANALAWPGRMDSTVNHLSLSSLSELTFEPVCERRFPCFRFAREVIAAGQSAVVAMNAANEVAVAAFLDGALAYSDIVNVIDAVLNAHTLASMMDIDALVACDEQARVAAKTVIKEYANA